MKVFQVVAKHVFCRCKVEGFDYSINPYGGCPNGCRYCFMASMKSLMGHGKDAWGSYLDVKNYKSLDVSKLSGKRVLIGSATDPYNPYEAKYRMTRNSLKILPKDSYIEIWTKSDLVLEDVELLKGFPNLKVGISICSLDDGFNADMEPGMPSAERRIEVLKKLHEAGIKTLLIISPAFPFITNFEALMAVTKGSIDEVRSESLSLKDPILKKQILTYIKAKYPQYYEEYERIYKQDDFSYFKKVQKELSGLCKKYDIPCLIRFECPKIKAKKTAEN